MDRTPRVSVLIPVYNGEKYLHEAIDSVLGQIWTDFELIVVDDGSTDHSGEIIIGYEQADARVRRITQENCGLAVSLNIGMDAARGRYLARLDADDRMRPERLALQLAAIQGDTRRVIIGSAFQSLDNLGNLHTVHKHPEQNTSIRWQALFHNPFAHPSVMFDLDVLKRYGLKYDPHEITEDYDLFSRLLDHGEGYNLPATLIDYREHPSQSSRVRQSEVWWAATHVARRNLSKLDLNYTLEEVNLLRRWFYKLPAMFSEAEWLLALQMFEIINRFSHCRGLDGSLVRNIRGQWTLRLLRNSFAGSRTRWPTVVSHTGLAGIGSAVVYGLNRLRNDPG